MMFGHTTASCSCKNQTTNQNQVVDVVAKPNQVAGNGLVNAKTAGQLALNRLPQADAGGLDVGDGQVQAGMARASPTLH
ncbi:Hypothetical predicted protein [Olea europaea subsp. europaea]|uniref:Uncharacterized protein n=1 Tax=Olea europaea subsp. europaea TaxID=158383 RepID=A0A8S0TRB6_OLEEU|nr:Hypothetical predicted protein [Olea europaea subsp. europaea]